MADTLDIGDLTFNGAKLGSDAPITTKSEIEITRDGHVLTSFVVERATYGGKVLCFEHPLAWEDIAAPEDVIQRFGEPYWRDEDGGEVILFYEYQDGEVELQFEFSNPTEISVITLARPGVLADAKQRAAYGVTKPWPPRVG